MTCSGNKKIPECVADEPERVVAVSIGEKNVTGIVVALQNATIHFGQFLNEWTTLEYEICMY